MANAHGPLDMNSMPDEVLEEILGWVMTSELVTSVYEASGRFRKLVSAHQFWQRKFQEIVQQQRSSDDSNGEEGDHSYEPPVSLNRHQLQRCCWMLEYKIQRNNLDSVQPIITDGETKDDDSITDSESESTQTPSPPSFLQHGSVLFSRLEAFRLIHDETNDVQRILNLASSTDHHHESVENVLDEETRLREVSTANWNVVRTNDRVSDVTVMEGRQVSLFSFRQPWWSSVPQTDPDTSETLAFCTRYPLTMVTEVAVKPYADWTKQTYSWKKMVVRVYNLEPMYCSNGQAAPDSSTYKTLFPSTISTSSPRPSRYSQANRSQVTDVKSTNKAFHYLESQTPVYESPLLDTPPPRNNAWQYHDLPYGVMGNVITITLVGKNFRQFEESGYYACVQRVAAQGIPVYESNEDANPDLSLYTATLGVMPKRAISMYRTSQVVPLLVV